MLIKILLVIAIVIQCVATGYALRLVRTTKYNSVWILFIVGFSLLSVERLIQLLLVSGFEVIPRWWFGYLGIVISVCLSIGVMYAHKLFKYINRLNRQRSLLNKRILTAVQAELEVQIPQLPRAAIARASVDTNGKIIVTDDMNKAIDAVNIIAPEHLEICVDDPFAVLNSVKNAGSIFLGKNVPEALGDYFAGPNHTLPTSGTARFSSPLGVDDFVKKSSFIYYTRDALGKVQSRIADFAEHEGLHAHAKSVTIRFEDQ